MTAPAGQGQDLRLSTSRVRDLTELVFFGLLAVTLATGFTYFAFVQPASATNDAIAIHQGTYRAATLPPDQPSTTHGLPSVYRGEVTIVARHTWGPFGDGRCDAYRVSGSATVSRSSWDPDKPCSAEQVASLLNTPLE